MTGSLTTPPPACPPWCDSDHSRTIKGLPPLHFGAGGPSVRLSGASGARHAFVFVSQRDGERSPSLVVSVSASDADSDPAVTVRLKDAEDLARLAEMLAVASPAVHREVAAAVRRAAAVAGER